jgi:two-component system phosphate regulon sensor histidine kinase PhoR
MVDKSRSRKEGGAGLGLALCQQIARLHGGRLEIRSMPGEGSCIGIVL